MAMKLTRQRFMGVILPTLKTKHSCAIHDTQYIASYVNLATFHTELQDNVQRDYVQDG